MDELDETALREPLSPVGGRASRRPVAAIIVAAVLVLVIAVPKPWSTQPIAVVPTGSSAIDRPSDARTATAGPDAYAPLVDICGSPGGWRAATLHQWPTRDSPIRTWSAVVPQAASGAEDRTIPYVDVVAAVTGLGYCSPRGPGGAPDDTRAEIWWAGPGRSQRVDADLIEPNRPHPLGGFWAPPPDYVASVLGIEAWRPGRYAIRLIGTAFDRWFGVEIREPPGPASPQPVTTPGPIPSSSADGAPSISPAP